MKFRIVGKSNTNGNNIYENLVLPSQRPNTLRVYHNTSYSNINDILQSGLLLSRSKSEKVSGLQLNWVATKPYANDGSDETFYYGGCTVICDIPDTIRYEIVNDSQAIIYDDIPPKYIVGIDYLFGTSGCPIKSSNIDDFIDEFGVDKVKRVLLQNHNPEIALHELQELTPELEWNND